MPERQEDGMIAPGSKLVVPHALFCIGPDGAIWKLERPTAEGDTMPEDRMSTEKHLGVLRRAHADACRNNDRELARILIRAIARVSSRPTAQIAVLNVPGGTGLDGTGRG